MNKFFKIILSLSLVLVVASSCGDDDETEVTPLRDYAVQYAADLDSLDNFLDTNYMTVDTDFNVKFTKIPTGGTQLSIRDQQDYPIDDTIVAEDGIDYKIYFLKFREGTQRRPTQVDSVIYLEVDMDKYLIFQNPVWFNLQEVVTGWSHIIPNFKTGTYETTTGPNPIAYDGYGAGVMFLPSGLGYYNAPVSTIAAYTPIIFSFKLYELDYIDHDRDGIDSKDEREAVAPNSDGSAWSRNPLNYDSDGDGFANMRDVDDDGDGFTTISELLRYTDPVTGKKYYYKYNGDAVDNPATPFDDTQGIPSRSGTAPNYTYDYSSPDRERKHLDKNWTNLN
jgi:hypothetical protein